MSKLAIILITLFASSTIILGALTLRYAVPNLSNNQSSSLSSLTQNRARVSDELPPDKMAAISFSNPALKAAKVAYTINGNITVLQNTNQVLQIITDINPEKLPNFVVSKDTKITFKTGAKEEGAKASDLKVKQNVNITVRYNFRQKKWATEKIEIVLAPPPSPSIKPK